MEFITKNKTNQQKISGELSKRLSASKTDKTAVIIGFRTYLYGPLITRYSGGAHGAAVPLPVLLNKIIVNTPSRSPKIKSKHPKIIKYKLL